MGHPGVGGPGCWCYECWEGRKLPHVTAWSRPFIVCPDCGNKRCPKATFHGHPCGNSNRSGQPGSNYR